MPRVKPTSDIAAKWARVTPQRAQEYAEGVKSPRVPWDAAAKAAEQIYEAGIQEAIRAKRYGKGVTKAGASKWQTAAVEKGTARYGPGVAVAEPNYAAGFAPYREEIERVALPPRRPKGDPANIERVRVIAAALNKKKQTSA